MPLASLLMHPVSAGGLDAVVLSCGVGFKNQCRQPFGSRVHDLVFHPDAGEVLVAHKRPTLNDCDFHSTPSNTTSYAPCERVADLREIYSLRTSSFCHLRKEFDCELPLKLLVLFLLARQTPVEGDNFRESQLLPDDLFPHLWAGQAVDFDNHGSPPFCGKLEPPEGQERPERYPLPVHFSQPLTQALLKHVPPLSLQAGKPRSTPRACLCSSGWCSFSVPNKFVKHHTFCRLFFA